MQDNTYTLDVKPNYSTLFGRRVESPIVATSPAAQIHANTSPMRE
jgi:hypothetical protein